MRSCDDNEAKIRLTGSHVNIALIQPCDNSIRKLRDKVLLGTKKSDIIDGACQMSTHYTWHIYVL